MATSASSGFATGRPLAARMSAAFHRNRVEELCARCEDGLVLLRGEYDWFRKRELRAFDSSYRDTNFKQEKNLYYLTGIEVPNSFVLIDPRKSEILLYTDWSNARELELAKSMDLAGIRPTAAFLRDVRLRAAAYPALYTLYVPFLEDGPMFSKTGVMTGLFPPGMGEPITEEMQFARRLAEIFPDHSIKSIHSLVTEMRKIKQPEEIRMLREANAASVQGLLAGIRSLRPGLYDHDVAAVIESSMLTCGAAGPTFSHNLMSGPNMFVKLGPLWADYSHLDRRLEEGDGIFIDVGAEVNYFVSDIGRTVPVSGTFTPEQRKLYELYLPCYLSALQAIRPGASQKDLVTACVTTMERQLGSLSEGYLRSAALNFVETTRARPSLGHYVDMNVIGAGPAPDEPLKAQMVFAIEPLLFCPDKQFGVFLEDNIVVTEDGFEVLSSGLPYTADEVEAVHAGSWANSPKEGGCRWKPIGHA
jgi:Xaa-Pro aminopeptidase